jgi:hypothetical protein
MEEEPKTKLDTAMTAVKETARKLKDEPEEPIGPKPATEDAFVPPPDEPKQEEPPKDPDPPSGSLSADDEEAVPVDFKPAPTPDTRP